MCGACARGGRGGVRVSGPEFPESGGGPVLSCSDEAMPRQRGGDALAERTRNALARRRILALHLMSSPGSGKTTLLERTLRGWMSVVDTTLIGWLDERDLPREQLEAWLVDQLVGMLRTTAEHDPATAEQLALLGG